ncbi:hypothetical protein Acsp03_01390 [Actinomadura sp. NBRC 104412]|uniref:hypothetical protein n=1 Tax=Actinomadura sp. NBRC 104412 TaxID=3032203 RepID=UPI0024A060D1|nr:hypothetical protein [Actinomadura sp. NBRC 104412]GLZ02672.1 hypothetical protein Acsp03_01390 [Actinomadura sp. NBRC 104412]
MRRSLLVGAALTALLGAGCAADPQPRRDGGGTERFTGFAGVVEETGNYLAIAVLGERVRMFVCDNADEVWLEGSAAKDGMVTLKAGGNKRVGFFNTQQGVGTFWIGGRLRSFKAAPVDKPAGLYRAQSPNRNLVGGWVVLPNGDQVGAVTLDGVNQPAPRIDPGKDTVTVAGERLALKAGDEQLSSGG